MIVRLLKVKQKSTLTRVNSEVMGVGCVELASNRARRSSILSSFALILLSINKRAHFTLSITCKKRQKGH